MNLFRPAASSVFSSGKPCPRSLQNIFLAVAGTTALGAPWMLGGETVRGEWWLLAGGCTTLALGLAVRWLSPETPPARAAWSVSRWAGALGFLFLLLLVAQSLNPSHRVVLEKATRLWHLDPLPVAEWAPKSLAAPFEAVPHDGLPYRNTPRYLLIFGIVWTFATGLALGLTAARAARRFAFLLGVNGAVLAIVCIAHVAMGSELTLWRFRGTFDFSHSPVFLYKNHNGAYLAGSVAIMLGLASAADSRRARGIWEALAFLGWVATVLVDSRVATACATLLWLAYLAQKVKRRAAFWRDPRRWGGVAAILLAGAGWLFAMRDNEAIRRFSPVFSAPGDFAQGGAFRVLLREVGFEMWADRPLTGWGGGSFLYLFNTYHQRVPAIAETIYRQQPTLNRFYWPTANCDWIEFAVEYGAVGWLLLAGVAAIPLAVLWRWRKRDDGLALFLALGSVALLGHAFFDYVLRNPASMILFASLWIVALNSLAFRAESTGCKC